MKRRKEEPLPAGWAVDSSGKVGTAALLNQMHPDYVTYYDSIEHVECIS